MRNPDRIEPILKMLRLVWKKSPQLRLTQLLSNVILGYTDWSNKDLYYVEDDKVVEALEKFWDKLNK